MTLDQKTRELKAVELLYYKVLLLRESYFQEHIENPGLFSEVVSRKHGCVTKYEAVRWLVLFAVSE